MFRGGVEEEGEQPQSDDDVVMPRTEDFFGFGMVLDGREGGMDFEEVEGTAGFHELLDFEGLRREDARCVDEGEERSDRALLDLDREGCVVPFRVEKSEVFFPAEGLRWQEQVRSKYS